MKAHVDYLYRQKECMRALNQVAAEKRDTGAKSGTLVSSLYPTITAIKEQQEGMMPDVKALRGGVNGARHFAEATAKERHMASAEIQIQTSRTRQELATMGEMRPCRTSTVVNRIGKILEGRVGEESFGSDVNEGRGRRRTLYRFLDWRYREGDNWFFAPNPREHADHLKPPAVHNRHAPAISVLNIRISEPPKFDVNRFGIYRIYLLRGRDIKAAAGDSAIIKTIYAKRTD